MSLTFFEILINFLLWTSVDIASTAWKEDKNEERKNSQL